jgi:hypothetical protein
MAKKPYTTMLLATVFLLLGLVGIAAFMVAFQAWLTTVGTSPLAALFTLGWSVTFLATAVLAWRRSRHAAFVFLAAIGFLLFMASYIFPGAQLLLLLPLFGFILLLAFLGYKHLQRAGGITT